MTNQGGGGDAGVPQYKQGDCIRVVRDGREEWRGKVIADNGGPFITAIADGYACSNDVDREHVFRDDTKGDSSTPPRTDSALAAKDAEIARLTKERDEANAAAVRYADASAYKHMSNADLGLQVEGLKRDLSAVTADRDALKDALNPKRTDAKDCLGYAALSDGLEIAQGFGDCVCEVDEYADKPNCDQGGET